MNLHSKFENVASDSHVPKTSFKSWKCTCNKLVFCVASYFVQVSVSISCQVMSLCLKTSIPLFQLNLQAFNRRSLTETITMNWDGKLNPDLVWLWLILSWNDFLSKIRIRTQIPLNIRQHNNNEYLHDISDSIKLLLAQ